MSNNTQRQHYLHQLAAGMQKRPKYGKNRRKISRFRKQNTS